MSETPTDETMRRVLLGGGPMNAVGALIFAPPFPWVRDIFGLPGGHELYLWIISIWILLFGIAYASMGLARTVDRTMLWVGAGGKAIFGFAVLAMVWSGDVPPVAALLGLPDLGLAAYFALWLLR